MASELSTDIVDLKYQVNIKLHGMRLHKCGTTSSTALHSFMLDMINCYKEDVTAICSSSAKNGEYL